MWESTWRRRVSTEDSRGTTMLSARALLRDGVRGVPADEPIEIQRARILQQVGVLVCIVTSDRRGDQLTVGRKGSHSIR